MRKILLFFLFVFIFTSCSDHSADKQTNTDSLIVPTVKPDDSSAASQLTPEDSITDAQPYAMRYVVIADTSFSYEVLEKEGNALAKKLKTKYVKLHMYDKVNGLHDDTIEYWYNWRRQAGEEINETDITIEMHCYYKEKYNENDKQLVLIAGMFYDEVSANKFLDKVKVHQPKAFTKPVNMFIGCRS